jgi:Ni,Fe-hydrogenase III large subunit
MPIHAWWTKAQPGTGGHCVRALATDDTGWRQIAGDAAASGGQLLALWATPSARLHELAFVRAAYLLDDKTLIVELPVSDPTRQYPGLESVFPAAARMQRAAADLCGVRSDGPDTRPWIRHAAWPAGTFPLRGDFSFAVPARTPADDYSFIRVEGEGIHEIAVGPVHAGIIEPGHFRFSIVGEKVLRLEEKFGYVHKGIERRFVEIPVAEGHRLAARVSGDSAAAFSWAYCQALEVITRVTPPRRALWLRALCLEVERIGNHLGDLGALGNDAGFAFGLAQFSRLKEELLRTTAKVIGQRYLLDAIGPGGVAFDVGTEGARELSARLAALEQASTDLQDIYDEHAGVRDRFVGAGVVSSELARRLGMLGLAARASGLAGDLRIDQPCAPYDELAPASCVREEGDVAARVAVRFAELRDSCRLARRILTELPPGECRVDVPVPLAGRLGIGMVEGWRGPVLVALETGPAGTIRRCYPHDPSRQNWLALEHAIIDNIVPDFPLINKSFNLSYSGHDL